MDQEPLSQKDASSLIPMMLLVGELMLVAPHFVTLFRLRLMPRKEVERNLLGSLPETAVVTCCALYTQKFIWLAVMHNVHHCLIFFTYDHWYTRKLVAWATLEWVYFKKEGGIDLVISVACDLLIHVINSYYLAQHLALVNLLPVFVLAAILTRFISFGLFPWYKPFDIPEDVKKTLQPL